MPDPAPTLDPSFRAAVQKLADIVTPPPASLVPQTWGWAVLGVAVLALAAWCLLRWRRRRQANRYRREGLAELARIERTMAVTPDAALAALPSLLKRVALAAWPRPQVAALSQTQWIDFLQKTEGNTASPSPLAQLLDDAEYRRAGEATALSPSDARACLRAARAWIEDHRVSA